MFNEYLGKLDDNQHVTIMRGGLGIYVETKDMPEYAFSRDSVYDVKLVEGKVIDIKNDNYKALKMRYPVEKGK